MRVIVDSVGAKYGSREVLRDISFTLEPGEIVGLVGPNGHGKTTLMKRMLEAVPGQGRTTYDGKSYRALTRPQLIVGSLLSTEAFHPRRSALNHLRMFGAAACLPKRSAEAALARVGLSDYSSMSPSSYSMGMKQRLGIAVALMPDPRILILDEPINGLDIDSVHWFRNTVRSLAGEGRTVLLSTHILSELEKVAERVLVLHNGRLRADCPLGELRAAASAGTVTAVVDRPQEFAARLRSEQGSIVSLAEGALFIRGMTAREVGSVAHKSGFAVFELSAGIRTLEDGYNDVVRRADSESDEVGQEHEP